MPIMFRPRSLGKSCVPPFLWLKNAPADDDALKRAFEHALLHGIGAVQATTEGIEDVSEQFLSREESSDA